MSGYVPSDEETMDGECSWPSTGDHYLTTLLRTVGRAYLEADDFRREAGDAMRIVALEALSRGMSERKVADALGAVSHVAVHAWREGRA